LDRPLLSATRSTKSDFVITPSFVPRRGRGGAKLTTAPDAVLALGRGFGEKPAICELFAASA
jgi:hypothetical protein